MIRSDTRSATSCCRLWVSGCRDCVRDSDFMARLGGDEFALVQIEADEPNKATALASRLIEMICDPYDLDGHQVVVGMSVGVALAPGDATMRMG